MVTIIATQISDLIPPGTFQYPLEECKTLIQSLTIKHVREWDYPHKHIVAIEYDSLLIGATFTFITEK